MIGYRSLKRSGDRAGRPARPLRLRRVRADHAADRAALGLPRLRRHPLRRRAGARASLGASGRAATTTRRPKPLDAAITFAPSGDVVRAALRATDRGATVAINAIHLDRLPEMPLRGAVVGAPPGERRELHARRRARMIWRSPRRSRSARHSRRTRSPTRTSRSPACPAARSTAPPAGPGLTSRRWFGPPPRWSWRPRCSPDGARAGRRRGESEGRRTPSDGVFGFATPIGLRGTSKRCGAWDRAVEVAVGLGAGMSAALAHSGSPLQWSVMPRLAVAGNDRGAMTCGRRRIGREHRRHLAVVRRVLRRFAQLVPDPLPGCGRTSSSAASTGGAAFAMRYFVRLRPRGARPAACSSTPACRISESGFGRGRRRGLAANSGRICPTVDRS